LCKKENYIARRSQEANSHAQYLHALLVYIDTVSIFSQYSRAAVIAIHVPALTSNFRSNQYGSYVNWGQQQAAMEQAALQISSKRRARRQRKYSIGDYSNQA
jgi:hypothetical protein